MGWVLSILQTLVHWLGTLTVAILPALGFIAVLLVTIPELRRRSMLVIISSVAWASYVALCAIQSIRGEKHHRTRKSHQQKRVCLRRDMHRPRYNILTNILTFPHPTNALCLKNDPTLLLRPNPNISYKSPLLY